MAITTKVTSDGATELTKTSTTVDDNKSTSNTFLEEDVANLKAGTLGLTGYDIVVGTAGEITNELATHTVDTFVAALLDNHRVYFRDGTHSLTRNETITESGVKFYFDPGAILDDGTNYTLEFSGDRIQVYDGRFTGWDETTGEITISGDNCYFMVVQGALGIFTIQSGVLGSMVVSVNSGIKTPQWEIDTSTGAATFGDIIGTGIDLNGSMTITGNITGDSGNLTISSSSGNTLIESVVFNANTITGLNSLDRSGAGALSIGTVNATSVVIGGPATISISDSANTTLILENTDTTLVDYVALQIKGTDDSSPNSIESYIEWIYDSIVSGTGPALAATTTATNMADLSLYCTNTDIRLRLIHLDADARNILIGTAAISDVSCRILGDFDNGYVFKVQNSGDLTVNWGMEIEAGTTTPTSNADIRWIALLDGGSNEIAYIEYFTSSPNARFVAASDERMKKNIDTNQEDFLSVINQLRIVDFDWRDLNKQPGRQTGMIAQEVFEVYPLATSYHQEEDKWMMGDAAFVMPLVGATQQLSSKIISIESEIEILRNRVFELENPKN